MNKESAMPLQSSVAVDADFFIKHARVGAIVNDGSMSARVTKKRFVEANDSRIFVEIGFDSDVTYKTSQSISNQEYAPLLAVGDHLIKKEGTTMIVRSVLYKKKENGEWDIFIAWDVTSVN